jgi:hypothetical protein
MKDEEERERNKKKKKELFLFLFFAYNRWWSWPTHTNTTSSRFTSTNFFSIKSILIAIFKATRKDIDMSFFIGNCCLKLNYLICGSNESSSEKKKKKFNIRVSFHFISWEI